MVVTKFIHIAIWRTAPILYNPLLKLYQRFFDFDSRRLNRSIKNSLSELPTTNRPIQFLSIGANDGFSNDPFVLWVLSSTCEASFVEPVADIFALLKTNYREALGESPRLKFHQVAISNFSGLSQFYAISSSARDELGNNVPTWINQLGSFDKTHIDKHLDGLLTPYIESINVKTYSLDDFLKVNHFEHLDVLHIDAEGHDYKIIESLNLERHQPSIILIEHKHLSHAEKGLLLKKLDTAKYHIREFRSDLLATKFKEINLSL
jgi:FkbM family methyltransferase